MLLFPNFLLGIQSSHMHELIFAFHYLAIIRYTPSHIHNDRFLLAGPEMPAAIDSDFATRIALCNEWRERLRRDPVPSPARNGVASYANGMNFHWCVRMCVCGVCACMYENLLCYLDITSLAGVYMCAFECVHVRQLVA